MMNRNIFQLPMKEEASEKQHEEVVFQAAWRRTSLRIKNEATTVPKPSLESFFLLIDR
jgi:hypothetical protein